MKKKTVLYVVVSLLAVFAFSALAMHYRNLYTSYAAASRTAEFPFKYLNGEVQAVSPEAEQSSIKLGDHIAAINGRPMDNKVYAEETTKMQADQQLMLYGTGVVMGPSFLIILYRIFSGAKGSFFDIVPFWLALFALLSMLLFPLTMAYVIVVHRAMDVSVVVRQRN